MEPAPRWDAWASEAPRRPSLQQQQHITLLKTHASTAARLPPAVAVAGLSLGGVGAPAAAHAQDAPAVDVDQAVTSLVDLVKATGEVVKSGVSAAQTGAEYAKSAYEQVRKGGRVAGSAADGSHNFLWRDAPCLPARLGAGMS